jgi:hypothetical protein
MKYMKYLWLLLAIMISLPAQAQFNPTDPPEPGVKHSLSIKAVPADGGSIGSSGKYSPGEQINLYASPYTGFRFVQWEDKDGKVLSNSTSMRYTMPNNDVVLTARFRYDPSNPAEPSKPEEVEYAQVSISVTPADAGTISGAGKYVVGTTVRLQAYNKTGFRFKNWTLGGEEISTSATIQYVVKEGENILNANFVYDPSNPAEPTTPQKNSRLTINVNPKEGGYTNPASGNSYNPGESVNVKATAHSGYSFRNWTDPDNNILSKEREFKFQMPDGNATIIANFDYAPYSPSEPGSVAPRRNVIYGGRISVAPGAQLFYDISLENVDEITGMTVDVAVPANFGPLFQQAIAAAILTDRANAHSISSQKVTDGVWRIFVTGTTPFKGGSGPVIRIPAAIPATVEPGISIAVPLSKGVVFKADGSQDPVDAINGIIKIAESEISLPDSPDFEITALDSPKASVMPGDEISVAWTVANNGTIDATAGWSETVSLTNESGKRAVLATLYYDIDRLRVGESVSRSAKVRIPEMPGIDGNLNVTVTLSPYTASGELEDFQLNNSAMTTSKTVALGKRLILELPETVTEGDNVNVRCKLSRSGDWTTAQSFTIKKTKGDNRLRIPETVTIARGQSGAYFMANVIGNDELDDSAEFSIEASGNGYDTTEGKMEIIDDEFPEIEMEFANDPLMEGESTSLSITLPKPTAEDLAISIKCDAPERFKFPATVTIAKGTSSASIDVAAIDNDKIEAPAEVQFKATAPHYGDGEAFLTLNDNDMPALAMTLTPTEVSEGAGQKAIRGKLTRTSNFDKRVTILFTDDKPGNLIYNNKMTMEKGVEEMDFTIGVTDNARVDGDRKIELTAAVFLQSCSCSATSQSGGSVSDVINVIDNDGPSLSLRCNNSTLRKDDRKSTITVERNTTTRDPVTVSFTTDPAGIVAFPESLLIPVGETSASVEVEAPLSSFTGVEKTITVNALSDGFAKGTMVMLLSDKTLPDATVALLPSQKNEFVPGEEIVLEVKVSNEGNTVMPDAVPADIYFKHQSEAAATVHTSKKLNPGESETMTISVAAPAIPGKYALTAHVNDASNFAELTRMNNNSGEFGFTVKSPFTASLDIAPGIVSPGEKIKVSGVAPGYGSELELYYISKKARFTKSVTPDADGNFTTEIIPDYSGDYIAGICIPGENKSEEMGSFTVRGMQAGNTSYLTFDIPAGETSSQTVKLSNSSSEPISGLKAVVGETPEGCTIEVECPAGIPANGEASVVITVTASKVTAGKDWITIPVEIAGENGVSVSKTVYYYCRPNKANLTASVSSINTTMTMGQPRVYRFSVGNTGKAPTGDITLSLPAFMRNGTSLTLPSIDCNESMNLDIMLTPSPDMQLNVPVSGKIGVNCANGDGLAIPYSIEPVSDLTGNLIVDVKDEYTFATTEAPHVKGATIIVSHPVTGKMIASGTSGDDGTWTCELPEGFYTLSVSADRHEGWRGTIQVAPGKNNDLPVFLSFNAISYSWQVEETTVDDTYEIVTTVEFETRVPKPVVVFDFPKIPYRNQIVYFTATNKGLVTATNVTLLVPESSEQMQFEIIGDNIVTELHAGESVRIPVRVSVDEDDKYSGGSPTISSYTFTGTMIGEEQSQTRSNARKAAMKFSSRSSSGCFTDSCTFLVDDYDCDPVTGEPIPKAPKAVEGTYRYGDCGHPNTWPSGASWSGPGGFGGGGGGIPGGGPGSPGGGPNNTENSTYLADRLRTILMTGCLSDCEKALAKAVKACYDAVKNCTPTPEPKKFNIVGCVGSLVLNCRPSVIQSFSKSLDCGRAAAGCVPKLGCPASVFNCIKSAYEAFKACMELKKRLDQDNNKTRTTASKSNVYLVDTEIDVEKRVEALVLVTERYDIVRSNIYNILGNGAWSRVSGKEVSDMLNAIIERRDNEGFISLEEIKDIRPQGVDEASFANFIERYNNSIKYEKDEIISENMFDVEQYKANHARELEIIERAKEMGFPSFKEMADVAVEEANHIIEMNEEPSSGVCASVTIKFNQTMVLTRQAFRGTLSITNGNEEVGMTDVKFNVKIRDKEGNLVGDREFAVSPESLDGFKGELNLSSGWALDPKATGTATILFIPSKYAAPVEPLIYSFGGTLSYTDPFTGNEVTLDLSPIDMTVSPSPILQLDYFMQRDILGDDPLTTDKVEASIPAEFALLVHNAGFGNAENLRMTTRQPEIVENSKGLALDFRIIGTSLNGTSANVAIGEKIPTEFGTLDAGKSAYAQWWLQSSLLGHFTSYDVKATQLSAYGSEDMSLLDYAEIHELIHGLTPGNGTETSRAFLVNDIDDTAGNPDMIFFSDDASSERVEMASAVEISEVEENVYKVDVTTDGQGWTYGAVQAPWKGMREVLKVERLSDGEEIPADNFWCTFVTLKNSTDPIYEDRLHLATDMKATNDSYRVTLMPRPDEELDILTFSGIPDEGETSLKAVKEVGVTFNKPIDPVTFDASDISLVCQGKRVDISGIEIKATSSGNDTFSIDFGNATSENGYYMLTVNLTGITDGEGFMGSKSSAASWIQFADGKVRIITFADPSDGGTTKPADASIEFGETLKLQAEPSDGYDFIKWSYGADILSEKPDYEFIPKEDMEITASFMKKRFMVEIITNEQEGAVAGASTGIYDYGTSLTLNAVALPGYVFVKWIDRDNKEIGNKPELTVSVKADSYIKAVFRNDGSGVEEVTDNGVTSIYPLPARSHIFISGDFDIADMVSITDLEGRHVKLVKGYREATALDVTYLPKGIYIVNVTTSKGTSSHRLVKL